MIWWVACCVFCASYIIYYRGMLWALSESDSSVLFMFVHLHLWEVFAIVSYCSFCRCILVCGADETGLIGLALLVVHCSVFIKRACETIIICRIVIIELRVVEVDVLCLAVWIFVSLIVQEPNLRIIVGRTRISRWKGFGVPSRTFAIEGWANRYSGGAVSVSEAIAGVPWSRMSIREV